MKGRRIPSVRRRRRRTTGRQNFKHRSWRAKIQALYPLFLRQNKHLKTETFSNAF
ncbi:hypothetical protein Hanom_Chr06g00494181 [Helianthus anomalus]